MRRRRWHTATTVALFIPAALITLLGSITLQELRQERREAEAGIRTHDLIAISRSVLIRLSSAEAAVRAYVITGQAAYLAPFRGFQYEADAVLDTLRAAAAAHPSHAQRVSAIERLTAQRIGVLSAQVARAGADPTRRADVRLLQSGARLSDSLRTLISALDREATRNRSARITASESRTRRAMALIGGSALLALLLSLTATVVILRYIAREAASAERVEEERLLFDSILTGMDEVVVACDADGTLTFVNRAARELSMGPETLRTPADWATYFTLHHADGSAMTLEDVPLYRALNGDTIIGRELVLTPPDGRPVWLVASAHPLTVDGERIGAVVVARDVTATRLAQNQLAEADQQLRQVQKMEAVGQLAGGVAHDFNNMLTAITSYAELALETLPDTAPTADDLREILAAAERAKGLTRQLLAFSRKQTIELRAVDLNEVASRGAALLERLVPAGVELQVRPASEPLIVESDPVQLEQILVNLVVNARDATSERGTVIVEVSRVELDATAAAQLPGAVAGSYALLSVSDDGKGMDPETVEHIFEPFFTTKSLGEGTGLGLSTVYGIVRQSRGAISVHSELNIGTTFNVYLPLSRGEISTSVSPQPEPEVFGTETVLVVDDEPQVRTVLARILETRGFTVLQASDGREALAQAESGRTIELLIADVVLPGMNGREIADALRRDNPALPVIFVSGYMAGMLGRFAVTDRRTQFVQKPFTSDALLKAVGSALSTRGRASAP